jgi:hypothetical protein
MRISNKAINIIRRGRCSPRRSNKFIINTYDEVGVNFTYSNGEVSGYRLHPSLYLHKPPKEAVWTNKRRKKVDKTSLRHQDTKRRRRYHDGDLSYMDFARKVDTFTRDFPRAPVPAQSIGSATEDFQMELQALTAPPVDPPSETSYLYTVVSPRFKDFDESLGPSQYLGETLILGLLCRGSLDNRIALVEDIRGFLDQPEDEGLYVIPYPGKRYPRVRKLNNAVFPPKKFGESDSAYVERKWMTYRNSVLTIPVEIRARCAFDMAKKFQSKVTDYGHLRLYTISDYQAKDLMIFNA